MQLIPCRDCGTPLPPSARGCPRCARNLAAERAVTKFVLFIGVPALLLLGGLLLWLLRRAWRG